MTMIDPERMRAIFGAAKTVGWREALFRESIQDGSPNLRAVFANGSRGSWRVLLPPAARGRILVVRDEISCLGLALARWCEEVVVCHPDESHLGFLAIQADEMGFDNVRPVRSDKTGRLPFPDQGFDAVILNAPAVGGARWSLSPRLLQETRRVLRSNGCIYFGASNRFGVAAGHSADSRTYSRFGYRRLLRRAGFENVQFCEALQGPVGAGRVRWRRRLKRRLQAHPWFAPSFNILAAPGGRLDGSWAEHLAAHVARELDLVPGTDRPSLRVGGAHSAGLIMILGRKCVVRVSLEPADADRVQRNFKGLNAARDLVRTAIDVRTPEPLLDGSYEGVPFTVESHLEGRTIDRMRPRERAPHEEKMFDLLLALKQLEPSPAPPGEESFWRQRVVLPLEKAVAWAETDAQRGIATEVAAYAAEIDGASISPAFSHGDFKWANMLVTDSIPTVGLVDWDRWDTRDFVSYDFLHFVCNHRKLRDGCAWPDAFRSWLAGEGQDEQELRWTDRFCERHSLRPGWELASGLAYWAREVASSAGTPFDLDRPWIRRTFLSLLPQFHARLQHRR